MGLTREQQQALALAAARKRQQESGRVGGAMRPVALVNQGISNLGDTLAGGPNRLVNRGIEAVGLDHRLNEAPFAEAFDAGGVMRAQPETLVEQSLVGAGEGAFALLPGALALRGAATLGGIAGKAAGAMQSAFVAAPVSSMAAEIAAGAAAPVAGELAVRGTGREEARPVGSVLGGMGAGLGVAAIPGAARSAGGAVMNTPMTGNLIRGVMSAVAPFTKAGGRMIAEDTLRSVTPDRFRAAENLAQENVGNLTPAQMTGDEGIMGIERARAAADPIARARLAERDAASQGALRDEVTSPAQGRGTRDMKVFFEERMAHHRKAVDRYAQQAETRVAAALKKIAPGTSREDASAQVVKVLDQAFDAASKREAELWGRIRRDEPIGTDNARKALADARQEATRISEDAIPSKARVFLGDGPDALGDQATMGELHRLYSELRRAGREAMAKPVPDEFTARQSSRIADAILSDIEATEGTSSAARLLADARAFSRELNEAFGQGSVARAMAVTRAGDERVPPETFLRATVGRGREAGGVAVDDIRGAVGDQADPQIQNFLRDEFVGRVSGGGDAPSLRSVDGFANQNREALSRFGAGVGAEVQSVRRAASESLRRQDRRDLVVAALNETKRGTVAGVVNAPKGTEIARGIFEADNPSAAARAIARAAQRDQTGDAYLGLKAGLADEVIRRSTVGGGLSGNKMDQVLRDPEMARVLHAALPPAELNRLRVVARQLSRLEKSASVKSVDTENLPNQIISTFLQIQAAKAGRAMGTGTIQVPGMIVSRARQLISVVANDRADAIIKAAMEDPQILSDLLVRPSASASRRLEAETRLANWAMGVLATEITE